MGHVEILTTLGMNDYQETAYRFPDDRRLRGRLFPVCLAEWLATAEGDSCSSLRVSALVTQDARNKWFGYLEQELGAAAARTGATIQVTAVPISEGANQEQLDHNLAVVRDHLEPGTRVVIDITNGFRSLQYQLLVAATFLKELKNIDLAGLWYGAFDARDPEGISPVFDLSTLVELQHWVRALGDLRRHGSLAPVLEQIQTRNTSGATNSGLGQALKKLEDASWCFENNWIPSYGEACARLDTSWGKAGKLILKQASGVESALEPVLEEIGRRIKSQALPGSSLQDGDAVMNFQRRVLEQMVSSKRWVQASTLLRESVVTFLVLQWPEPGNWNSRAARREVEGFLGRCVGLHTAGLLHLIGLTPCLSRLLELWMEITASRNPTAHVGFGAVREKGKKYNEIQRQLQHLTEVIESSCSWRTDLGLARTELDRIWPAHVREPLLAERLMVRCGERFQPPDQTWELITLEAQLTPELLERAIPRVRDAVTRHKRVQLLIAGPLSLGVALGQALEHVPTLVEYLQVDQHTKEMSVWTTNQRNL